VQLNSLERRWCQRDPSSAWKPICRPRTGLGRCERRRISLHIMKSIVKEAMGFVARYSGAAFLIREVYARKKVSIVVYHNPSSIMLSKHLAYLVERYTPIRLEVLIRAIYAKDWSGVPPKALVITLDDGLRGNFKLLKVFRRYQVVPTIYLCSQ